MRIIFESDSQLVIKFINGNTCIPKEIITLVEGIKTLSSFYRGIKFEYCNRLLKKDVGSLAKKALIQRIPFVYSYCNPLFLAINNVLFDEKKMLTSFV